MDNPKEGLSYNAGVSQLLGYDSVVIVVRFGVRVCREIPVEFLFYVSLFVNSILTADVCLASLEAQTYEKSFAFGQ